jgi:hypothetical protein
MDLPNPFKPEFLAWGVQNQECFIMASNSWAARIN